MNPYGNSLIWPEFDLEKGNRRNGFIYYGKYDFTVEPPPKAHLSSKPEISEVRAPSRALTDSSSSVSTFTDFRRNRPLPPKKNGRVLRNLRYTFFSIYRRLFSIVFLANLAVLTWLVVTYKGIKSIPLQIIGVAAASNITFAILVRQEWVVNSLFEFFGSCPQWVPLRIRRLVTKVYHLGGLHSGCAVAALLWFLLFTVTILRDFIAQDPPELRQEPAVVVVTLAIVLLLTSIVITALPSIRVHFHNGFEVIHRFAGWSALGLLWVHTVALTDFNRRTSNSQKTMGVLLVKNPIFWLLVVTTFCIIQPWLRLRKVPVRSEFLSNHAIRFHFTHRNLGLCEAVRVSESPLREWHAFAGIPAWDGNGFSVVVSNAGDWTKRQIANQPTKLWVRGTPTKGVMALAPMFKKIVLVATGSGIGPCLSLLMAYPMPWRVLWSTPSPIETYGKGLVSEVLQAEPEAIIIDTRQSGRPDLVRLSWRLYKDSGAEAVFVISNPKVTRKIVYGLESRGIPVFAPIFDS
jgi:hypothetical protein